jgi:hypothetical protein
MSLDKEIIITQASRLGLLGRIRREELQLDATDPRRRQPTTCADVGIAPFHISVARGTERRGGGGIIFFSFLLSLFLSIHQTPHPTSQPSLFCSSISPPPLFTHAPNGIRIGHVTHSDI